MVFVLAINQALKDGNSVKTIIKGGCAHLRLGFYPKRKQTHGRWVELVILQVSYY